MSVVTNKIRFLRAFQSRAFTLLWSGQTISSLGDGAFQTAQAWQVLLLTGSASMMGIVLAAETIPLLLFLLIGGVIADSLPRRFILIISDGVRGAVVLVIVVLSILHLLQIWHIVCLSLVFGLVRGFFRPAYKAIQAEIVPDQDRASANALTDAGTQMRQLVGPALGAACITLAGPVLAFTLDGLTFIVSMLCSFGLYLPARQNTRSSHVDERIYKKRALVNSSRWHSGLKKFRFDMTEGLQYVLGSKWLWISIVIACIFNIGWMGPLFVTLPNLVHNVYHADASLLGILITACAVGSIAASFVVGQLSQLRRRGLTAYLFLLFPCAGLLMMGLPLPLTIAPLIGIVASIMIGLGLGVFNTIWTTVLQELVPNDKLGRVSSIDALSSFCFLPVGYALVGILTDTIGPTAVFLCCGLLNFALVALGLSVRDIRHMR